MEPTQRDDMQAWRSGLRCSALYGRPTGPVLLHMHRFLTDYAFVELRSRRDVVRTRSR